MIWYLTIILRLTIWFLLTSDLSVPNIIIGITIALLLPSNRRTAGRFKDWLRALGKIVMAVPIAYMEAIEMIFRPHNIEEMEIERVPPNRSPESIFLDVFLITFTPKTIVTKYHGDGGYEVHRIKRRQN
jgi:multicomponent Na+:H+ antiporter subunit E